MGIYIQYIYRKTTIVVLASEPVGGRSRVTELPCFKWYWFIFNNPRYLTLISGVSFIAPHINNLYFLRLCRRYGVYAVVYGLFILKLVLSVIMLLMGPDHMWLLALYIARLVYYLALPLSALYVYAKLFPTFQDDDWVKHLSARAKVSLHRRCPLIRGTFKSC